MDLPTIWFLLIAVLFTGYFILEGFDFGVGMLLPVLGRTDRERRVLINTIGPVWDGNEVWLLTAGGAMFAAFPEWYATLFSGFYLPLLVILMALIVRGVAFEYRTKRPELSWKARWDKAIAIGSWIPAVLWGVAVANIVRGVPLDANHEYVGGLVDLLHPYALLGGLTTAALFLTHGALFISLKTVGDIQQRATRFARRSGVVTAALAVAFLGSTMAIRTSPAAIAFTVVAALALLGALVANRLHRDGWAFTGTAVTIACAVAALFAALFPAVLPSTMDPAGTLTIDNAASTDYTLTIMSWVAVLLTPIVLAYQGWTYWVFRKRISVAHIPD